MGILCHNKWNYCLFGRIILRKGFTWWQTHSAIAYSGFCNMTYLQSVTKLLRQCLQMGYFREQDNQHTSLFIKSWGICRFLHVTRAVAKHCFNGMGRGKIQLSLWKTAKHQKGPLSGHSLFYHCSEIFIFFIISPKSRAWMLQYCEGWHVMWYTQILWNMSLKL